MTELSLQEAWQAAPIETELRNARDYGPEPIDAKTAMGAANLAEVMAESRSRLKVRAALLVGLLSASDLMEPEETTEC